MNARQKAKKYKKMAERYKDKANAWDAYLRYSNHFYGAFPRRNYGTIETLRVAKYWDNRVPEKFIKERIAEDLANYILREGFINFEIEAYNEYNDMRRIIGTLKVTKGGWNDEDYY
jgi:hypothetical protein